MGAQRDSGGMQWEIKWGPQASVLDAPLFESLWGGQATKEIRRAQGAASLSGAELCGSPGWTMHWKKDGDNVDGQGESPALELASTGEEIIAVEN